MFDFVQGNKRLVQIIFALIVLPFALWGIGSYEKMGASPGGVASVNGSSVSRQDFENALRFQQDRLRKQLGANFDPALLDNPEMKRSILDNLVTQRLLLERARVAKLVETDERIAQVIGSIEAFQNNGKFDKARYEEVLKSQNMTPLFFESRLRDEFVGQQMRDAYAQNGFAANSTVENVIRLNQQQRVVSVAPVVLQSFMVRAKVDETQIQQYYEKNQNEFQIQEQAKVEYVKLSVDGLLAKAEVSKEEAQKYYEEHQGDFGTAEERQASHILVSVTATALQAEQDAAKNKATQLLQEVKQSPAKFAELAKVNSQDPGSASKGGDLGYFARGMMVKPFEDAAFSLKVGEVSDLVKSDFGYHIIKLVAIKPARVLPFDEAREGIVNKLRQQKAMDMFAALAERFSNTVYEQSDTLKPAAELAGTKVEQSGWLNKGTNPNPPWTAKMLQAIFTDDVTKRKRNTAAIEVDVNTLVAARMLEYKPASISALSDVKDVIRQKLMQNQARDLAVKQGKETLAQLQSGVKPVLSWGAAQTVSRNKPGALDATLVRQVFQVDAGKLPQYVGTESSQSGYMIVRVDAVKDAEVIDDATRKRYAQELRKLTGEELLQAYLGDARKQANIKINLPDIAQP